ncbi:helicase loader [Gordonia phage Getalong]|uniref:Uncharacterized protein n=4 Tax=Getalongvirus TaxID=2733156 RepID=A0A3S9UPY9_9CAUD|nr:hypothetical protein HOS44_gp089 [Gordonia phage BENtherdunthat]YP_009814205.1 hypothetical protein HOU38_gp092 [Gordonia phage Getalong]YP_009818700.1 hypothetical protein HOU97_gp84 [Gordonia phage Kenna]QCG77247.1 helicase loader [Gordonia phage Lutum]USH45591.1 helicase loader [Gordonia phage Phabuloso]ATW60859.1 helicase loader [Gordonia phage BENtherdunthat]AYD83952.1 helicase loader [Gordonia phage Getalong]AZS12360.1 helicase loader [Gordonia phage Kenna]
MNRNQIIDLLTAASAYDRRTIGEGDVVAWSEAARRAGWTFDKALNALHDHFASTSQWLMPGHITERLRLASRQPAPADQVLALDKPVASPERRAELMAQIRKLADRKSIDGGVA